VEISVVAEGPGEVRRSSLLTVVNRQDNSWLEVTAGTWEMVSRIESIGYVPELRSTAAVVSAKYCRRMTETINRRLKLIKLRKTDCD